MAVGNRISIVTGTSKSSASSASSTNGVRAVERCVAILSAFTPERPDPSLEALSETLGLPKSTIHRLLSTLIALSYVERGRSPGTYRLGIGATTLGRTALLSRRPGEDVHRVLEDLAKATGETVAINIGQRMVAVTVDGVESHHPLRFDLEVGAPAPAHCTAAGKVLLARLPDFQILSMYTQKRLPAFTHNTPLDTRALIAELETVRDRGYAIDDEEYVYGLRCIAVPVRDRDGRVEFALSVSGVAARLSLDDLTRLVPSLEIAASDIARRL